MVARSGRFQQRNDPDARGISTSDPHRDSGAWQICKVCNQMSIVGTLVAVAEAFALSGRRRGSREVREALWRFRSSRLLEVNGERILQDN